MLNEAAMSSSTSLKSQLTNPPDPPFVPSWSSRAPPIIQSQNLSRLTALPWELQLLIISHLDIRSVVRLRQTCRLYLHYFTVDVFEKLFSEAGCATGGLLLCCVQCLSIPPSGDLVLDEIRSPGQWRSLCLRCWRIMRSPAYYRLPYQLITFAGGRQGRVCMFCGWPIISDAIHPRCRKLLLVVNGTWWTLGAAYFCLLIVIIATIWIHYGDIGVVIIPAVLNFVIAFGSITLVTMDYLQQVNTTCFRIPIEIVSTLAWLPAVFYSAHEIASSEGAWSPYPALVCGLFAAGLLTHVMNIAGYILLTLGYDTRNHSLPGLSKKRKVLYWLGSIVVYWTYVKFK